MLKFDVIGLSVSDVYSQNVEEQWMNIGANLSGFLMLHIFKHISIGPLFVLPDWMPLSECDHHWMCVSAGECLWVSSKCKWMWLNTIECTWEQVDAFWVNIECDWTHLSAHEHFEWVWTWFNSLSTSFYMRLSAHECIWASVNALECDWTCLSVHECLWVRIECAWTCLSACECLWASIEWDLHCMWVPLIDYWTYTSVHILIAPVQIECGNENKWSF